MSKNEGAKMGARKRRRNFSRRTRIGATRLATKLLDVQTECAKQMRKENEGAKMKEQKWMRVNEGAASLDERDSVPPGWQRSFQM